MNIPELARSYDLTREFSASLRGQPTRFFSKPGLPYWDRITPSQILLAEKISLPPNARTLLLGCGHGALAVSTARLIPESELWTTDISTIALQVTQLTLQANHIENASIHSRITVLPEMEACLDAVLIDLPKGRKLAQRWLVEAHTALLPSGVLFLAGANDQGIQSVIRDAEALFGAASVLGYKKGNRMARLTKGQMPGSAPEWLEEAGIRPGTWQELDVRVPGGSIRMVSLPGVFSSKELDEGTRLLLTHFKTSVGGRVLDLGCGYGLIGLLAARSGAAFVDLVDVNLLAVASAQENLSRHGIVNAKAFPSDALSAVMERRYTQVISNPPFHTGITVNDQVTQAFVAQAYQVLEPGGQLWLVANRFLRYERMIKGIFQKVEIVAANSRYQVFQAFK